MVPSYSDEHNKPFRALYEKECVIVQGFYYVYALKDPTFSPANTFYIGKGTGSRAYDHLIRPNKTRKYTRIRKILDAGLKPLVEILIDDLSETQALRLEAELISALGTEETGGHLTNSVVPAGMGTGNQTRVVVPQGAVEQAQLGLAILKGAVVRLIDASTEGLTNADLANSLGLRSDYRGRQKDYLSYSLLGLLPREGRVSRKEGRSPRHVSARLDL